MFKKIRTAIDMVMFIWAAILAVRGLYQLAWDVFTYIKNRRNK